MKMFATSKSQGEKDRERQKRRRSQLSQQELEIQRAKDREAKRLRRAQETPEQKKLRLQKDREMHRLFRAHQSYDQKQARLKRERELRRRARAQEKLATELAHKWLQVEIHVPPGNEVQKTDTLDNQPMTVSTVEPEEIYKPDVEATKEIIIKQEVIDMDDDMSQPMLENEDPLLLEDDNQSFQ